MSYFVLYEYSSVSRLLPVSHSLCLPSLLCCYLPSHWLDHFQTNSCVVITKRLWVSGDCCTLCGSLHTNATSADRSRNVGYRESSLFGTFSLISKNVRVRNRTLLICSRNGQRNQSRLFLIITPAGFHKVWSPEDTLRE